MLALAAILQGPPQAGGTLFDRVIGRSTGQNGYEEYVAAAQIALQPQFKAYEAASAGPPKSGKSVLSVWKGQVDAFKRVQDLVEEGNDKEVFAPRRSAEEPAAGEELPGFPPIEQFLTRAAYVALSRADPDAANRSLYAGLILAFNIDNGTEAALPTVKRCADEIFRAYTEDLPQFGVRQLDKLADDCGRILAATPPPLTDMGHILADDRVLADRAVQDPLVLGRRGEQLRRMNPRARTDVLSRWIAAENVYFQNAVATARKPEETWFNVRPGRADPVASRLASGFGNTAGSPLREQAELRTRLRLLRLYARVYLYRWENDRLPAQLSDAAKAPEVADPLSGQSFSYSRVGDGFRITSAGSESTGPIALEPK